MTNRKCDTCSLQICGICRLHRPPKGTLAVPANMLVVMATRKHGGKEPQWCRCGEAQKVPDRVEAG